MKVLVTGGAGFIGSHLADALVRCGDEVIVLDNLSSGFKSNIKSISDLRFIEGDIRDSDLLDSLMGGIEAIYHLGASVGNQRSLKAPMLDADVNVMGTVQLLEKARQYGVKKMVVSSSAAIYGTVKQLPVTEDHTQEPLTPYGCSKLYIEKITSAYAGLHDMEVVCLRYFNVYGPHQRFDAYGNVIPIFMSHVLNGLKLTVYGDGEQTRDFVSVHDVVAANQLAGRATGFTRGLNIASGATISVNQLIAMLSQIVGFMPEITYQDKRVGDVLHCAADISAARSAINYRPTINFEQGLKEYYEWYKNNI